MMAWMAGFARVPLEPGEERRVTFQLHADRTAFTGRAGTRMVEPGEIGVAVGGASDQPPRRGPVTTAGPPPPTPAANSRGSRSRASAASRTRLETAGRSAGS